MLPRADILGTRPATAAVEAPLPVTAGTDARQEVYHRLAQIPLGEQQKAEVLKQLEDGTFLVRIANAQARMVLPNGTRVGDSLLMTMLTAQPRPVFLVDSESGGASTQLSAAGRLVTALLREAEQQNSPTVVTGKAPLLSGARLLTPGDGPSRLEGALQQALTSSGLFYESHLEDWINGTRSANELAAEPQAKFPSSPLQSAKGGLSPAEITQLLAQLRQSGNNENSPVALLRDAAAAGTDVDTIVASSRQDAAVAQMDPKSVAMIHQQLHVLEQRQVTWQGELWPGHRIEWEVSEERQPRGQQEESQPVWYSTVRFHLPLLGEVSASLRLAGGKVGIDVQTQSTEVATLLMKHGNTLADALDAAGSPLDYLQVKHDEEA